MVFKIGSEKSKVCFEVTVTRYFTRCKKINLMAKLKLSEAINQTVKITGPIELHQFTSEVVSKIKNFSVRDSVNKSLIHSSMMTTRKRRIQLCNCTFYGSKCRQLLAIFHTISLSYYHF